MQQNFFPWFIGYICRNIHSLSPMVLTRVFSWPNFSQGSLNACLKKALSFELPCSFLYCLFLARLRLTPFNVIPILNIWSPSNLVRFLILIFPQVMSEVPRPAARILLGQFSQSHPYSWCFLLVIFYPITPTLLLGYKFLLLLTVF